MLKTSFSLLLLCISFLVQGQTYKDDIRTQFLDYTDLLIKKDFSKSIDYLNPDFLKITTKDQLLMVMEKTYNNPSLGFEISKPTIISVDDKTSIDGREYVKFGYSNYLTLHFITEDGKVQDTALTKKALENQFGQNNVTYNSQTDQYKIQVFKKVIADSKDNEKWTFVVVEEKQKSILEKILPKELLQN
jgi:hypothetical protein